MIATITNKIEEANNILGFRLRLEEPFNYRPGQYVMVSLPGRPEKRNAYSIVDFDNSELYVVVKKRGDFTSKFFSLPLGTEISCGPSRGSSTRSKNCST